MKQIRIAFGVLLLALCVGTSVTAQLPPDPGCTDCAVNNSVILANVNSTFDSTAVVSGSFLAVPNVTVAIQVYGASTDGGVFGGNAASTINTQNKMWSGTINNLKEQNYNFYAIATFSDGTVLSSTFSPSAITSQKNKRNE